tara:strand:+ start:938 stop:1111 length:174 start_codon:yes stop_codon:yes gene_type:complete
MKKELKWEFEVLDISPTEIPAHAACTSMANCYFTRPLYDDSFDQEEVSQKKVNEEDC